MARNRHPEQTIKLITSVAFKLFLEKGYNKTSIQDIINETKLSKGGIYHHFNSKEEIFEAVFLIIADEIIAELSPVLHNKDLTGAEKFSCIFKFSMNSKKQQEINEMAPDALSNPRLIIMQLNLIKNLTAPKFLAPILEEGMKDGSIKENDPLELAEAIMVLVNVWLNPSLFYSEGFDIRKRCNVINKMLSVYGIEMFQKDDIEIMCEEMKNHIK